MQDTQTFIESLLQDDQSRKFPLSPYSGKRLGGLFGAIFGVRPVQKRGCFHLSLSQSSKALATLLYSTRTQCKDAIKGS